MSEKKRDKKPTLDGLRKEIMQLVEAKSRIRPRMRYESVRDILEKSGLPYKLVQDTMDTAGDPSPRYWYRFTSDWDGPAMLYIQETFAGRQYPSARKAIEVLEMVLQGKAAREHSAMCRRMRGEE